MNRQDRHLIQIQLLILQMERQLVIITAMIVRQRRRWGLRRGQQRHIRYWVRPWLTQAEHEEEGQYTRLVAMLKFDYPMAYRNFIWMPPELFQEQEQRLGPEIQRERTWMREPLSPRLKGGFGGGENVNPVGVLVSGVELLSLLVPMAVTGGEMTHCWGKWRSVLAACCIGRCCEIGTLC